MTAPWSTTTSSSFLFHSPPIRPLSLILLLALHLSLLPSAHSSHPSSPTPPPLPSISLPSSCPPTFSVTSFGAKGDGLTYDTLPIQAAINASSHCGGGTVVFPSGGTYLTATILLRSYVTLHVDPGATLLGGARQEDYPSNPARWYVVLAEGAVGAGITGGGNVSGQGWAFVVRKDPRKNVMVSWNATGECRGDECRPRLVGFIGCRGARVWNVNLVDPAYWCLHLVRSDDTEIRDVKILGDFNSPNNDGIDIEDSNNTLITRCHIDTGDDAICPKSSTGPVHNLTATDSWIRTKSSAVKLGSASFYEFHNFLFRNLTIVDSHRGLAFQLRDGGGASDITFSDIRVTTRYYDPLWWGRAEPIYVTTCRRDSSIGRAGAISRIRFVNVTAVSENGVFLAGSGSGGLISGLEFRNVDITLKRWTPYAGGIFDYRPGCREMVSHDTAGFMVEHVHGMVMENVTMRMMKPSSKAPEEDKGWGDPFLFRPGTVGNLSFKDLQVY